MEGTLTTFFDVIIGEPGMNRSSLRGHKIEACDLGPFLATVIRERSHAYESDYTARESIQPSTVTVHKHPSFWGLDTHGWVRDCRTGAFGNDDRF